MSVQLLQHNWFGKAVGVVCAFVFAPHDHLFLSVGIIIGIAAGHLFDVWAAKDTGTARKPDKKRPSASADPSAQGSQEQANEPADTAAPSAADEFLFTAMGFIAKKSQVVLPEHIRYTERVIKQRKLTGAQRQKAIDWFTSGKATPRKQFNQLALSCLQHGAKDRRGRYEIVQCLCAVAALQPTDQALEAVVSLAETLQVPPAIVAKEFGLALNTRRSPPPPATRAKAATLDHLQQAFATLGIEPTNSMRAVKTAYRRAVSKAHPDKLGANADAAAIARAGQQVIKLRDALETIQRG